MTNIRSLDNLKRQLIRIDEPGVDVERAEVGDDWFAATARGAETLIGLRRLDNLHDCIETVLRDGILGDVAETGVWRGGAMIFARAALVAYGAPERTVWLCDSFAGVPPPDPAYPHDATSRLHHYPSLVVDAQTVQENFLRYGLLSDRVKILPGWFRDTLPTAPIERLAVLRLDGDLYESTHLALTHLYPKLSPGGFCIVDDYGAIEACRLATDEFIQQLPYAVTPIAVDWGGVYWRLPKEV